MNAIAPGRRTIARDNVSLEILTRGDGPLVIMIPSLGRGGEDFDDLATRVASAGYRAICPQPRGLGASRGPLENITLHDYAQDVAAIIRAEGGGPAIVAGHAFGNFVARASAADYPQLVCGVALLAATHTWPLAPELRDSINKSHQMELPDEVRLRHLQHVFFAPGNDARVWLGGWDEHVMHAERDATEATPRAEYWSAGTAPVLDMQSACDPLSPPETRNCYVDEWGAGRVTVALIPQAAHALLPEQPEAVAAALIAFLNKLTKKAP